MSTEPEQTGGVALLDAGFDLFRRSFAAQAWIYYASATPVALLTLWLTQQARMLRLDAGQLWGWALVWAFAYCVRTWGAGLYMRRVLHRELGVPWPPCRPGTRVRRTLRELGMRGSLVALWLVTLPLLAAIPYVYVTAQYASLSVEGKRPLRTAWGLARRNAGLPWLLLLLTLGFWAVLAVNLAATLLTLPALAHALLGIGGSLTLGGAALILMGKAIFWQAVLAGAYLALDPVVKCALTVSYFHLDSERSGARLWTRLAAMPNLKAAMATAALLTLLWTPRTAAQALTPAAERQALAAELQSPGYRWHNDKAGPIWQWLGRVGAHVAHWLHPLAGVFHWIGRVWAAFLRWLFGLFGGGAPATGAPVPSFWRWVAWAVALLALGLALSLALRRRRRQATLRAAPALKVEPVGPESARGDERPEEEWFALAQQLAAAGELRLALRAAFLAGLAGLAARQWLTIERDHTNREYVNEYRRRARLRGRGADGGEGPRAFGEAVQKFNAVWYGGREIGADTLAHFVAAQRELLGHAG